MQDRDKVEPVAAEKANSKEDAAIAERRKLIGQVLIGSPAVLFMTAKSLRAQTNTTKATEATETSPIGVSEPEPTS